MASSHNWYCRGLENLRGIKYPSEFESLARRKSQEFFVALLASSQLSLKVERDPHKVESPGSSPGVGTQTMKGCKMEYASVWDALHGPSEASFMKVKSRIVMFFQKNIDVLGCSDAEREWIRRGKISAFSFRDLMRIADKSNIKLDFELVSVERIG